MISPGRDLAPPFTFPDKIDVGLLFDSGSNASISATAIDKENNVYVSIGFKGTLDGVATEEKDILILKYNSKGTLLWKRHLSSLISIIQDSSQDEDVTSLIYDEEERSLYFFGSTKSSFMESNPSGNNDLIIGKLSSSGNVLWLKHYGEETKNALEISLGLSLDFSASEGAGSLRMSPGRTLIAAFYTGGSFFETSAGTDDLVVMSVNPLNGKIIRGRQLGSTTLGALGASGAGQERHTQGSFDFDGTKVVVPFWTSGTVVEPNTNWDAGYVVLNEDLSVRKIQQLGTVTYDEWVGKGNYSGSVAGHDQFRSVVVLGSDDYLFYGKTSGSVAEPVNGAQDLFFARYKNNELQSLTQLGMTSLASGTNSEESRVITRDERGNIYCIGHTRSPLFESVTGIYWSPFVLKVDEEGRLLSGIQLGNVESSNFGFDNLYYALVPSYSLTIKDGRVLTGVSNQLSTSGPSNPYLWSFPAP